MEASNYGFDDLHRVQLGLLRELKAVCEAHGLTWFLGFGSLLGAVRESRIIPWDNSIDVVMPYGDYERLFALPASTWPEGIFLQALTTEPQYRQCYAKLRNSATTLVLAEYADLDINHGIYINIMPLVRLADEPDARRRQLRAARSLKTIREGRLPNDPTLADKLRHLLGRLISAQGRRQKYGALMSRIAAFEAADTQCCFALAGYKSLELALQRSWFASAVEHDFEDMQANLPCGWHELLTLRYGDYSTRPIAEIRADKSSDFVTLDTERPYTYYKGKTYCVSGGEPR